MKILHLYYDLMNLYGDYANISTLSRILETNGIEHTVHRLSITDEIDFNDYDFVFIGSGSEENEKVALAHLAKYKEDLKDYIESEKLLLMTGNAFEMLGSSIKSFLGDFKGLGIFDFTVFEQDKTRTTADAVFGFEKGLQTLVGFVNKCSTIQGIATPLFSVEMGLGNALNDNAEGIAYKNLFGTHLTGPILVKNPEFLGYIASLLAGKTLKTDAFSFEKKAYDITLKKLRERK